MGFINWIVEDLNNASEFFYSIYLEVLDWPWPLWIVAEIFYDLSRLFSWLAWDFSDFGEWVYDTALSLRDLLDWSTIWSYITIYVPNLEDLRDWFYDWYWNVYVVVAEWWLTVEAEVKDWIDEAIEGVQIFLDQVSATIVQLGENVDQLIDRIPFIDEAQAWFTDPAGHIIDAVISWGAATIEGVQDLIDSEIKTWFPFYDDLAAIWGDIVTFFTDPWEYLVGKFTDWFLGSE